MYRINFNLNEVLPAPLAETFSILASMHNMRQECYLTALLCALSGLQNADTKLTISQARQRVSVSPNLFGAIVADPSQRERSILRIVVSEHLESLDKDAVEKLEGKTNKRRIYFFNRATKAAIRHQITRQGGRGMVWIVEELARLLREYKQYSKITDSEIEDLLSYYNGTRTRRLQASRLTPDLELTTERVALSIIGWIAPSYLRSFLGDTKNKEANKLWKCFLFVHQPLAPMIWVDKVLLDWQTLLKKTYSTIDSLPAQTYRLSPEAFDYFEKNNYSVAKQQQNAIPKNASISFQDELPRKVVKLALNLHVLNEAFGEKVPDKEIPLEIFSIAEKLGNFYQQEFEALYI